MMLAAFCFGQIQTQKYISIASADTITETRWATLYKSNQVPVAFRLLMINSQKQIELMLRYTNHSDTTVSTGDSLWIITDIDSRFALPCLAVKIILHTGSELGFQAPGESRQAFVLTYGIIPFQSTLLESRTVEKIRISTSKGNDEWQITGTYQNLIPEAFRALYTAQKKAKSNMIYRP
jgi:hypothetical protein